jgi:RNA polymerase sigma-70 factor (ECF subfamily)
MRRRERGTGTRAALTPATKPVDAAAAAAPHRTDAELLREVAGGDRAAFGELYDRLAPGALALGYRMLGSRREAEDLVHDVFLECWRDASLYDPTRASVRTWLLVRTRSRSLDRMRSARRTATLPLDDALLDRLVPRTSDSAAGSERGMLNHLLRQLSSEQRAVVELGYFAGYSTAEIAIALAIPVGTVKSRMTRALDKLRLLLRRHQGAHS